MTIVRVKNKEIQLAENAVEKTDLFGRALGLMFSPKMDGFDGLFLDPCKSIHTCFMRYNIDVIFYDNRKFIVGIYRNLVPWRMTRIIWRAAGVLELPAGKISENVSIGDELEVLCTN